MCKTTTPMIADAPGQPHQLFLKDLINEYGNCIINPGIPDNWRLISMG